MNVSKEVVIEEKSQNLKAVIQSKRVKKGWFSKKSENLSDDLQIEIF